MQTKLDNYAKIGYARNKSISWNYNLHVLQRTLSSTFHAEYGSYTITVEIESGVVQGKFPRRALSAVLEWYALHKNELMKNWELAMKKKPLNKIKPLE